MHRRLFARRLDTCFPTIRNHSSIILSRSVRVSHIRAPSRNISLTVVPSSLRKEQSCSSKKRHNPSNLRTMYISKPSLYEIFKLCTLDFFSFNIFIKKGKSNVCVYKNRNIFVATEGGTCFVRFLPRCDRCFFFCMYKYLCVHAHICVLIYSYIYIYTYTYIHIYIYVLCVYSG